MPDLLHLTTEQWIEFWTGVATVVLGVAAIVGTRAAVILTREANTREAKRDEQLDRDRVDRWLAEFIVAATDYWTECDAWIEQVKKDADDAFRAGYSGVPDELETPPEPKAGRMLALLDAARLVARDDDRAAIKLVSDWVNRFRGQPVLTRTVMVWTMTDALRDWRAGESDLSRLRPDRP